MTDIFVVIQIITTCDDQAVYVAKDSAEIIEISWSLLDAITLKEIAKDSVLIRPVNTPITALCTSLTTLTWEHVRTAGTFKDGITKLDQLIHEKITSKNLDFTFVTLNAWELRVQLPREAREKSVVLPPYLQHSKVFDLKQEYSKWQSHHPEALSYSASDLSSIVTALEAEIDQSTVPFQLSNIQASPRRAYDDVELSSSILKALIKKSQPLQSHPDVLTRPFDARADVRAFLAEKSKVLHLSNLPHDTTQSELESWFTQYGGRPIAFWTLKTPDQHKSTGSGFAVFASHEEAAESLAMNGRALNERSIEVQPSSVRVLDRAQEILTPFPPSKNRPRPGDWTCPSCGFSNFQRRTACFRCSFPAASAAAIQDSLLSPAQGNQVQHQHQQSQKLPQVQSQTQVPQSQQLQQHQSNQTNNNNFNHNNSVGNNHTVHITNSINTSGNTNNLNHGGNSGHSNHNNNNHHHNNNNNNSTNVNGGKQSSVPFRAGDWKCGVEGCSYHNFAKNICCLRCGAPRVNVTNDQFSQSTTPTQQIQSHQVQIQPFNHGVPQSHHTHHHQHQQSQVQPVSVQSQQFFSPIINGSNDLGDLSSKINDIQSIITSL